MRQEPGSLDVPVGLEQRCVRPGEWIIEGYTVRQIKILGAGTKWFSYPPGGGQRRPHRTLEGARRYIWLQISREAQRGALS